MKEISLSPDKLGVKRGSKIVLVKRRVFAGNTSAVLEGQPFEGTLQDDIQIGKSIITQEGSNTSGVQNLVGLSSGRIYIDTNTSRYELMDKDFKGLNLKNEFGSIQLPVDSQPAKLDDEVYEQLFNFSNNTQQRVYINKPMLKDVLLESQGAQIFRGMKDRLYVLTRVGDIHLPFYISSSGTDGKNQGEWYPFFGYNGEWVIKGNIHKNGKMTYHPLIDKVNETLNQNLSLPIGPFIRHSGRFGVGGGPNTFNDPQKVLFDLNEHFTYAVPYASEEYYDSPRHADRKDYISVQKTTGYNPTNVTNEYNPATSWINSIVTQIK